MSRAGVYAPVVGKTPLRARVHIAVATLALFAITVGILQLRWATDGLLVTHTYVDEIPVTIFRPAGAPPAPMLAPVPAPVPAPVIVIAHGFAGSQQLMQPFAVTLARNGYVAVTFDFPGHGRNPQPLRGGLADEDARNKALLAAMGRVVDFAQRLPGIDGRIGLLGHSMGSDIVIRYGQAHPTIAATIAVSPFARGITPDTPRDLLIIVGALEPAILKDGALHVVESTAGGAARQRQTYGDFTAGTARRVSFSSGVEHIGVLYSRQSMVEALDWMNQVFDHRGDGYVDHRGPWLGTLFGGLVALAWPLSKLLPVVGWPVANAGLTWSRFWIVAMVPALLTPVLLWRLPTDFLPILLGDYLVVHFAVYGLLTLLMGSLLRHSNRPAPARWLQLCAASLAVATYNIAVIGYPIDHYITSFIPTWNRLPLVGAMLVGTLPYFIADEWATRGASAPRGGYAATKLCFIASLMLAVVLNPPRLFFLVIIIPIILVFFLVYGCFSRWAFRRTRHPLVGALANALAFAWAIAVTFPVIG
jgi:dienelactone hydrolase